MFASIVMFAVLALVMFVVSSEVYAALKAVQYAVGQNGSAWVKTQIAYSRYMWSSVVFHEFFHDDIGRAPAYRVSVPLFIWAGMMAAYIGAYFGVGIEVAPWVMMGSSLMAGVGFFAFAYGPAFLAAREDVTLQTEAGTWKLA